MCTYSVHWIRCLYVSTCLQFLKVTILLDKRFTILLRQCPFPNNFYVRSTVLCGKIPRKTNMLNVFLHWFLDYSQNHDLVSWCQNEDLNSNCLQRLSFSTCVFNLWLLWNLLTWEKFFWRCCRARMIVRGEIMFSPVSVILLRGLLTVWYGLYRRSPARPA